MKIQLSHVIKQLRKSIFARFVLILMIATLTVSFFVDSWTKAHIEKNIKESLMDDVATIMNSLDWSIAQLIERNETAAIQRLIENTAANRMIDSVTLFDAQLKPLIHSSQISRIHEKDYQFVAPFKDTQLLYISTKNHIKEGFKYAIPIRGIKVSAQQQNDILGYLLLSVNQDYILKLISASQNQIRMYLFIFNAITLPLVWITVFILWMKPLQNLNQAASAIGKRDYTIRVMTNNRNDEIGRLEYSFNQMAEQIQHYVTELTYEKDKAKKDSEDKMQFFANMSHELRTPLNIIIGYLGLLEDSNLNSDVTSKLRVINRSSGQLLDIVNDLLDIAKFDLDEISLENIPFSLPEMMIKTVVAFQPQFENKDVRLAIEFNPEGHHNWRGDPYRIQQILNNLLSNALKFTAKGSVKLSVFESENALCFHVQDTGIGISESKITAIFDAYKQMDMSTTREYGGTGLGLTIVKKLCMAMGGNIDVESVLGEGTLFKVRLMLEKAHEDEVFEDLVIDWQIKDIEISDLLELVVQSLPERIEAFDTAIDAQDKASLGEAVHALKGLAGNYKMTELYVPLVAMDLALKGSDHISDLFFEHYAEFLEQFERIPKRYFTTSSKIIEHIKAENTQLSILLAEDIIENRKLIQQMLASCPCTIVDAENGEIALEKMAQERYDLLFLDMHMPVLDGMGVLKSLVQNPHIRPLRVVALTASTQSHEVGNYLNHGVDEVLPKPVDKLHLHEIIESVINEKLGLSSKQIQ